MLSLCHYVNSYSPEGRYEHDYFLSALADLLSLNFFTLKQCILENGHISATGRPIHSIFGCGVGFSGTVDLMALFLPTTYTASLLAFGYNMTSHHC